MDAPFPAPSPRHQANALRIKQQLAAGVAIPDRRIDELFSHECHDLSRRHWTPVAVAMAALSLLRPHAGMRVLDVGSGCGKFCLVAAMYGPGQYTGVELRPQLVAEARRLQGLFNLTDRIDFLQGDATVVDLRGFDAIYLYNPFYEGVLPPGEREPRYIDTSIDLNPERYWSYLDAIHARLLDCPAGTKVLSYHGFGAKPPASYRLHQTRAAGTDELALWIKET